MKYCFSICVVILIFCSQILGASEPFYAGLSESQRYDLADAYNQVADKFADMQQVTRADAFRKMADIIFPDFSKTAAPKDTQPSPVVRTEPKDPSVNKEIPEYYFKKLLHAVFNENILLSMSVIGEPLYLPMFNEGINSVDVNKELTWFFDTYEIDRIKPEYVFKMNNIDVNLLDNGYWRVDVEIFPEYVNALPELTFWTQKMGFYFRQYPEGWRLGAIGPVS